MKKRPITCFSQCEYIYKNNPILKLKKKYIKYIKFIKLLEWEKQVNEIVETI